MQIIRLLVLFPMVALLRGFNVALTSAYSSVYRKSRGNKNVATRVTAATVTSSTPFSAVSHINTPSTTVHMAASSSSGNSLPKVFFVLGGPGAGKGTQCTKLSSEYGLLHISAGELLREERNSGSSQGELIESIIKEGNIVPSSITVALIEKAIKNSKASRILVDGFPRNLENLDTWNDMMKDQMETKSCIFIECPETELERRILLRGQSSGRSDDNMESARKRFSTYKQSTLPVVEHFTCSNQLITIRGDQAEGDVWSELKRVFSTAFIEVDPQWQEEVNTK